MDLYINLGTYLPVIADELKAALEKKGIPVKVTYPGTSIGRESGGGAQAIALTLSIPSNMAEKAKKIQQELRIAPVKKVRIPMQFVYISWVVIALLTLVYLASVAK